MSEKREEQILTAAIEEFANHSYYEAKTDAIAERAGVSKGLVFHYFGSKEKLYLVAVKQSLRLLTTAIDFSQAPKDDLVGLIVWATAKKMLLNREFPLALRLVLKSYGNASQKLQDKLQSFFREQEKISNQLFEEILAQMTLKKGVSKEAALGLIQSVFASVHLEAGQYLKEHPNAVVADFDFLFAKTKEMLELIQYGMCQPISE